MSRSSSTRPPRVPTAARLVPRPDPTLTEQELADLESLVGEWLTVPQLSTALDMPLVKARNLLTDRDVIAIRRGPNAALYVPAEFVAEGVLIKGLTGTLRVLTDAGFDDAAALRWLFTPEDSLPGTPVAALAGNRGTEVKRRAQALAL